MVRCACHARLLVGRVAASLPGRPANTDTADQLPHRLMPIQGANASTRGYAHIVSGLRDHAGRASFRAVPVSTTDPTTNGLEKP